MIKSDKKRYKIIKLEYNIRTSKYKYKEIKVICQDA